MDTDEQINYQLPGLGTGDHNIGYGFVELTEGDHCFMDLQTVKTLELLQNNIDDSNKRHSLFGYLNIHTCTTIGSQLLKEAISKPLCHLPTLEHRLNCIDYLTQRVDTLAIISNSIRKYGQNLDLSNIVNVLVNLCKSRNNTLQVAEKRMECIANIEVLLSQVEVLTGSLANADQPTLNIFKVALEDPSYSEILNDIHELLEPDVKTSKGKRGRMFRIKPGVEALFDVARSTYHDAINEMECYVRELQRDDNIPWKLNYSEYKGYFLSLTFDRTGKNIALDSKYMSVSRSRTMITCTTRELMQLNVRANMSYENSMRLANEILEGALTMIASRMGCINKLVEIVGMLDLITSFAKLVTTSKGTMVRPKFNATETIIVNSRHPVLESILEANNQTVIPNDVKFSVRNGNLMLITGPNMGGKSIFLRQVGVIQVMAQMGCFVPAESAHIKLMNKIVARSGTSDDNDASCSSFMWEMRGIASALSQARNAQNQSVLYIIDEVGRGTSIDYGASYSFAIGEELGMRKNCFTVFSTHFEQVFSLTSLYSNVRAYSFKYEEKDKDSQRRIKINHNLSPGLCKSVHYGVKLAEASGFPSEVIQLACKDFVYSSEL